jgi:succinyl-CoA synthetase beta subunit
LSRPRSSGGVKLADNPDEAVKLAGEILGMTLVTKQTGPEGKLVRTVLIEEALPIDRELYLGVVLDRSEGFPVMMASKFGGMEIEEVAAENPDAILKAHFDPDVGLHPYLSRKLAFGLGLEGDAFKSGTKFMHALAKAYGETDASLLEINPLVTTTDGRVIALDAKMNVDDSSLYRHKDIAEMRDIHEEEPLEVEASKYDLNYIKLDGNIGCMVNGAGLAMATMDIIKHYGGEPANFLDVGGDASASRPTSSMSGATPPRSGWQLPSESSCPTRRSRVCWSTSSAASCAATWWRTASSPRPRRSSSAFLSSSALKEPTSRQGERRWPNPAST